MRRRSAHCSAISRNDRRLRRRAVRVAVRFVVLATVAYAVGFVPIVPFLPVCHKVSGDGATRRVLIGLPTDEFAAGLRHMEQPKGKWALGNMVFITVGEWIHGYWSPYEVTTNAIWHVLIIHRGISREDARMRRIGLPEFHGALPTCRAVRAIAFRGGKWSREGPSPTWSRAGGGSLPWGFDWGRVPGWRFGYAGTSFVEDLYVWLSMNIAFGIALGYLWAIWRERSMRRNLAKGGAFGLLLSVVIPLILVSVV